LKHIFAIATTLLSSSLLYSQDVITLKIGEAVNGKVAEVGINEIKYYKSTNLNGPVYIVSNADVAQITYQNGTKDVFTSGTSSAQQNITSPTPNTVVVQQTLPQVVVVERPVRRGVWPYVYPLFVPHIDLGHHLDLGHYSGGHHAGGHH
jgi:hypothetical protein